MIAPTVGANDRHLATDRLLDFTMREYSPTFPVTAGALSAASLLGASLESAGSGPLRRAIAAVRSGIGRNRTIWAAIDRRGVVSWELYWYNRSNVEAVHLDQVLHVLDLEHTGRWVLSLPRQPDVFSLDIDNALVDDGRLESVNVYVGNPVAPVPSGYSYRWSEAGPRLSNAYYRFPRSMIESVRTQLTAAMRVDVVDSLLWEDISPCDSLHVANKIASDCLYYGGVDAESLITILARCEAHPSIRAHLESDWDKLRHLRFDVGLDVEIGRSGYSKVAVYGAV